MSKSNIKRIIMIIVLFAISLTLFLLSNHISKKRRLESLPTVTPSVSATLSPSPSPSSTPSATATTVPSKNPTASPSPTPIDKEYQIPIVADPSVLVADPNTNSHLGMFSPAATGTKTDADGVDYFNYYNLLRRFTSNLGTIEFQSDGGIMYTDNEGRSTTSHISDYIDLSEYFSGQSDSASANWFFTGAINTKNYIFASYDYWGKDELKLFVRLEKNLRSVSVVYACFYNEPEYSGIFTATDSNAYYVYKTYDAKDSSVEASILRSDLDGSNVNLLISFSDGYEVHHLYPYGDYVYFMLTNTESKVTSLMRYNTMKLELSYVVEKCNTADYLYIINDFAIVGRTDAYLKYYSVKTGEFYSLKINSSASIHYGNPMTNGRQLYIPYFTWNNSSSTSLIMLDLVNAVISNSILVDIKYYYLAGISGNTVYAEDNGSYKLYSLD